MKLLVVFILFSSTCHVYGQVRIEKVGAYTGIHRVTSSYNYLKDNDWIKKKRTLTRQRIGAKITYPIAGRLSIETGLLLDNLSFKKNIDRTSYYAYNSDSAIILQQHQMIKMGVPLSFLFHTYQTEACVTYIKLTFNNQVMVYEQEQFLEKATDAFNTRSTSASEMNNSGSGFDFSNSDIEFSFGTYFNIKGVDAQFSLEPKFSLYNYVAENSVNSRPDLKLYDAHTRIYGAIGFEVTMYKVIEQH
jgi:hypothetical protein